MRTDDEIRKDVEEELKWEPLLHDAAVKVSVKNGGVTLSGTTTGYRGKLAANQAAARVKGANIIKDEIIARLPVYNCLTDKIVTIEIMNALRRHSSVPAKKLAIKVKNAIVELSGEVDESYQLEAALNAIRHLRGIKDIVSSITVKPGPEKTPAQRTSRP